MSLDADTCARLSARGWVPPGWTRGQGRSWPALAVVLALHLLFAWVVWLEMRPPAPDAGGYRDDALHVRLIVAERPAAPPPAPAPPPSPPPAARPATPPAATPSPPSARPTQAGRVPAPKPASPERPARDAMTATLPAPAASAGAAPSSPRLYGEDGRILLPTQAPAPAANAAPGYVQRLPQGDAQVMRHASPLPYKATRFDDAWGKGGGAVTRALDKAVQKTTVKTTIRLPKGVRIHCALSLAMLAGGCGGDPPPPPSAKDGDERLSMAPAAPLAKDPPPPPSEAECIALYRDGKPLPHGCPVDTPNRSVDAEARDCIERYRAGKRLPTWCPADTAKRAAAPASPSSRP
ncbi:hypothetical protein [Frateuria defendens]|uniref:hypothetical protein n=1 Tax=Frateuria defendens TaxID=2219559 RepID=UPI0007DBFC3C|nr:hypothetical protein [Frateuria defendens]